MKSGIHALAVGSSVSSSGSLGVGTICSIESSTSYLREQHKLRRQMDNLE